jgi:hypothetical protein
VLLVATTIAANAVTYNVNRTIDGGSVSGTIETDGTLGTLSTSNILSWAFTIASPNLGQGTPQSIDSVSAFAAFGSLAWQASSGLTATATELLFDFSAAGFTYFSGSATDGWCLSGAGGCGSVNGPGAGEYLYYGVFGGPAEYVATTAQNLVIATTTAPAVPVPASLPLLVAGLGGFAIWRRRVA